MKVGVVYKFKTHNKINGSLFYCYEYCQFLRNFVDCTMYVVSASANDVLLTKHLFDTKYGVSTNNIQCLDRYADLYSLKLDKTVVLDIDTFNHTRGFLTNEVLCFSNVGHPMYRYKESSSRNVTYYGSYPYQNYDVFSVLKLNFDMFTKSGEAPGVFISGVNSNFLGTHAHEYVDRFRPLPVIVKSNLSGDGNVFDKITAVHYVHTCQDTNNRIIPESFFHGKNVTIDNPLGLPDDSAKWRFNDIRANGLGAYTLTEYDAIVQACLK